MIKLLAIDLDGTLINSDLQISKKDIKSIRKCRQNGIIVSIVTGRSIRSVGEITGMLNLKGLHLASSGAAIVDEKLKIHKVSKVSGGLLQKTVEKTREWNRAIVVHTTDGFLKYEKYFSSMEHIAERKELFKEVEDILAADILNNSLQMTILIDEDDEFNQYVKEVVGESAKIRRAGPYFLNIMNNEAGKLFGVKEILRETGLKKDDLMVIGDAELDIGIIKYAGIGVAMGNALQNVKDHADYLTSDNDSSGVSEAIEKYILAPLEKA